MSFSRRPTSPTIWSSAGCRSAARITWSAELVRLAVGSGRTLSELTPAELADASPLLDPDGFYALLADGAWLESKASRGGTGSAAVREQLAHAQRGARARAQRTVKPDFYRRPVLEVAEALIGCVVTHGQCSGVIVETEAYHDSEPASPRLRRSDPADRDAVRAARTQLTSTSHTASTPC